MCTKFSTIPIVCSKKNQIIRKMRDKENEVVMKDDENFYYSAIKKIGKLFI